MEEVFVYICEHTSSSLERMIRSLLASLPKTILIRSVARQHSGYVEYDGSFFISERVLGSGLLGKGIEPGRC